MYNLIYLVCIFNAFVTVFRVCIVIDIYRISCIVLLCARLLNKIFFEGHVALMAGLSIGGFYSRLANGNPGCVGMSRK